MSALPYCILVPTFDKKDQSKAGLIIGKIASFKPYRIKYPDGSSEVDYTRSTIFMDNDTFHFCSLSVEEIADLINRVCDGDVE